MKTQKAGVVICGAGIAGISCAYHLAVEKGVKEIVLVDERSPLTLTSDKSTECYRNWWPGPDNNMIRFMNRSIDLLEKLAEESDNYFNMNHRGYSFLTGNPEQLFVMKQSAEEISRLGAGPLRYHRGKGDGNLYTPHISRGFGRQLDGADFVLDSTHINKHYPFITDIAIAMLHARRCGWLSAQQLGMYLLDQAKAQGLRFIRGRIVDITSHADKVETVRVSTEGGPLKLSTCNYVIAAGPLLKEAASMIGIDLPVFNELHGKIAFSDPVGIISRHAPLMIWEDPVSPYWNEEERKELSKHEHKRHLLDVFPGGVHFRPEGGSDGQTILALWTYDIEIHEPVFPPAFKEEYAEIVMRGLVRMIPELSVYLEKMNRPVVDGGYYCKTKENRPLIGPLPVKGAYVIGALSGFGIMAAMAAGELLANHLTEEELPEYASAFLPSRYQDTKYQKLLETMDVTCGQL